MTKEILEQLLTDLQEFFKDGKRFLGGVFRKFL